MARRLREGWVRRPAGHYEHPKHGEVWRGPKTRKWWCRPRSGNGFGITRGTYDTLRSAIADCERESA